MCSAQQERSWDTDFSGSVSRAEFVAGLASVGVRLEDSVLDAIFDGAERGSGEWSSGLDTIPSLSYERSLSVFHRLARRSRRCRSEERLTGRRAVRQDEDALKLAAKSYFVGTRT